MQRIIQQQFYRIAAITLTPTGCPPIVILSPQVIPVSLKFEQPAAWIIKKSPAPVSTTSRSLLNLQSVTSTSRFKDRPHTFSPAGITLSFSVEYIF